MTVAELVANAPNTGVGASCGPIVHSLGVPPNFYILQPYVTAANAALTGLGASVTFQYVTADNSAVYVFAKAFTGAVPAGIGVHLLAIR
jgi:hypothetical protein